MEPLLPSSLVQGFLLNLKLIERFILKENMALKKIGENVPCFFHIHNTTDFSLSYINNKEAKWLNTTREKIRAMGDEYFDHYYLQDYKIYFNNWMREVVYNGDFKKINSGFHLMFNARKNKYVWVYSVSKLLAGSLGIATVSLPVKRSPYAPKTKRIQKEYIFMQVNQVKFKDLTKREVEILHLVASGSNNPHISSKLHISRNTVEQHRKNINRKLGVSSIVEIIKYAQAFDVI